ncbi:hypothetical protein RF11_11509 [Thelohanellus kitauei]|uniref:Uncharacterized protein n=1 Tax=Thelohanellus kitauei TaxID=669202 RepID=A0A0C2JPV4_THEKT|nr:hypothetical protein RF11_11509 [Thelohanellus kitauei]
MTEIRFYKLLLDDATLQDFLVRHGLIINADIANHMSLNCRNQNSDDPSSGYRQASRKRKLTQSNLIKLQDEGENISTLPTLRCRSCNTYLSPRTKGFLSYFDTKMRANCK